MRLIFLDGFWVVHIPFSRVVKFKLLAQFPVDHLLHWVVSSLVFVLCLFTAFAYHVIDCFISITTSSPSDILLRFVYSCFDIVLMALFCVVIRRDSVFLWGFFFLSHVQVFSLVCCVKCPCSCFSSYFSVLFIFVLLMFVLSVFLVTVINLSSRFFILSSCPSFLDTYSLSTCIVISFPVLRSICRSSSLVYFKNGPENLTRSSVLVFIPLMRFLLCSLYFVMVPRILRGVQSLWWDFCYVV